jgi:acyl-CoA thioesterase-1
MPFVLNEVAGNAKLNQEDGIHPNAKGHEVIAKHITEFLEKNL